jgi:hypothetical protein
MAQFLMGILRMAKRWLELLNGIGRRPVKQISEVLVCWQTTGVNPLKLRTCGGITSDKTLGLQGSCMIFGLSPLGSSSTISLYWPRSVIIADHLCHWQLNICKTYSYFLKLSSYYLTYNRWKPANAISYARLKGWCLWETFDSRKYLCFQLLDLSHTEFRFYSPFGLSVL